MDRIFCIVLGAMIRQMDQRQIDALRSDILSLKPQAPDSDSEDARDEWLQHLMAIDQAEKFLNDALK